MTDRQIEHGDIHLWRVDQADFDLPAIERACLAWLTENEMQRFRRYQFNRHRKQLLLSRILTRVALSHYDSAISPAEWQFSHNEYGKPAIRSEQNKRSLHFNLSHSRERAVLAVSAVDELGVDIEYSLKPRRIAAIAERYFSASETGAILALPVAQQQQRFYDLWTLKEAYIKACGMGLAIPLQHFSYGFVDDDRISLEFDAERRDSAPAWQLWQVDAGSDYKLAIAARVGEGVSMRSISSRRLTALDQVSECATSVLRSS